jgi:hypothetical protein
MLVSCLVFFSTLKMEPICYFKTLIGFHRSTGHHTFWWQAEFLQTTATLLMNRLGVKISQDLPLYGACGSVVGWGTMLQAGRSPVRVLDVVDFFNWRNPSSRTMALGSTQPLTEMSTRNLPGGKKRPAHRAEQPCRHLWAEYLKMWELQPLATLRASTVCTGITLPFCF